jgi:hypothetical protein
MIKQFIKISLLIIIALYANALFFSAASYAQTRVTEGLIPEIQTQANPSEINTIASLPGANTEKTWQQIIAQVIKFALGIAGSLAIAAFTVGGVMMVTAQGDEGKITKGKDIITWSLIALGMIAVSYGIVVGVTRIKFFQ